MHYIPSQADCNIIKQAAADESTPSISFGAVILEPGIRVGPKGENMNVLLTTDDPKWTDTDLGDYAYWKDFRAGVELTEEGHADVDFYIRRRNDSNSELYGNVTVEIRNGRLVRVYGYPGEYYNIKEGK